MSNQDINNARFSAEALEWDSNVKHVESTGKALEAIQGIVPALHKDGRNKGMCVCTDTDRWRSVYERAYFFLYYLLLVLHSPIPHVHTIAKNGQREEEQKGEERKTDRDKISNYLTQASTSWKSGAEQASSPSCWHRTCAA